MSYEEFLHILEQLSGQTKYIYYHLMGEPLMHPQLCSFIKAACRRDFQSVITTNGTLLGLRGAELLDSGVYKVNISIHSFEGEDEKYFENYMEQVTTFADVASRMGIIVVLRLWNRGYDEGRNDKILSYLKNRLSGEWAENTKGIRIRKKLHLEWGDRFEWPDKEAKDYGDRVFCYGLRDHFGILCDGSVVPCCLDSDGVITLGNIFEESITDILSSQRAKNIACGFEKHLAVEELCRKCGYAQRFR